MVRIFPFSLLPLCVKYADRIAQHFRQVFLNFCTISFFKAFPEGLLISFILSYCPVQPLFNLVLINFPHLFIRNFQPVNSSLCLPCLGQISRCKQHTPKIFDTIVYFIIGQLQPDFLFNQLAGNQSFNFILRSSVRFFYKMLYQIISTGIDPVSLWFCVRLVTKSVHMIDHIPWTVHICIPKAITVIPFLHFRQMCFQMIIRQQLFYFLLCKTELFIKAHIRNGKDLKVVQPGKNTLL